MSSGNIDINNVSIKQLLASLTLGSWLLLGGVVSSAFAVGVFSAGKLGVDFRSDNSKYEKRLKCIEANLAFLDTSLSSTEQLTVVYNSPYQDIRNMTQERMQKFISQSKEISGDIKKYSNGLWDDCNLQ